MDNFITIKNNVQTELVEKKSKFIANLFYVESVKEAEEIITKIKKKYFDARHNCIAYRVIEQERVIEKSNDDGEPSGTAGAPMLNILSKENIVNTLVIVTRYFGGILLGTGGLVKAYSESTKLALEQAKITKIEEGYIYKIEINYSDLDSFKYYLKNNEIKLVKEEYFENVVLYTFMPKNKTQCFEKEKINGFNIIKMEKQEKTHTKIC